MSESHRWFAAYADFIPQFGTFCAALYTPPACCLRVNTLRTTPDIVRHMLARQEYRVRTSPVAPELLLVDDLTHPGALRAALLGYYQPQTFTSALASLVLAPRPHERRVGGGAA